MISIIGQCSDCCTCPTATVEWDSRSASKTVGSGFGCHEDGGTYWNVKVTTTYTPPNTSLNDSYVSPRGPCPGSVDTTVIEVTGQGYTSIETNPCDVESSFSCSGSITYTNSNTQVSTLSYDLDGEGNPINCVLDAPVFTVVSCVANCDETTGTYTYDYDGSIPVHVATSYDCGSAYFGGTPEVSVSYTDELTDAFIESSVYAALPAYNGNFLDSDYAGSFRNKIIDPKGLSIRESHYRIRFPIPTSNTAKNLRAVWVERFIAEAGVSISSVSVNKLGVYRPTVTLSPPPSGGTQAYAVAVMSSTGTVASISILDPGTLYTSAPTVTVQTASGGGTTSTGWTATLTAGSVTAIAGGTAGNYRPTLAFSGGGGSSATATCTVNAQGGIDVVTMTASGTAYTSEPTLTITSKVSGSTAADLLIHMGTETSKCTVWDGAIPSGYNPATSSTWPILPSAAPHYYSLAVPATDRTTLVANMRTYCDGTPCP